jgi:hypothetical protein
LVMLTELLHPFDEVLHQSKRHTTYDSSKQSTGRVELKQSRLDPMSAQNFRLVDLAPTHHRLDKAAQGKQMETLSTSTSLLHLQMLYQTTSRANMSIPGMSFILCRRETAHWVLNLCYALYNCN